jgi:hypothetical protein
MEFKQAVEAGRAGLFNIDIGGGHNMMAYIPYGYTGGSGNKAQAKKTDIVMQAIALEIKAQPRGPICICGDINADPQDIPTIQAMLDHEGWVDLGAKASIWGQPPKEHTCLTPNAKRPTRRDYVFVNSDLFPMVTNFSVIHDQIYPTHSTLRFRVSHKLVDHHKTLWQRPLPLSDLLEDHFQRVTALEGLAESLVTELRSEHKEQLHVSIVQSLSTQAHNFAVAQREGDVESYWRIWRQAIEHGFLEFVQ